MHTESASKLFKHQSDFHHLKFPRKKGSHMQILLVVAFFHFQRTFTKPLSGTNAGDPESRMPNPISEPLFAGVLVYLTWLMKLGRARSTDFFWQSCSF